MATQSFTGYAFFIGKDTDPDPALTGPSVRFVPSDLPTRQQCEAWLRQNPGVTTYPIGQVSNIQVVDTTGGGGSSSEIIAVGYNPGTSIAPETGTNFQGLTWTSGTVKLN